jgi:hypothetical protein
VPTVLWRRGLPLALALLGTGLAQAGVTNAYCERQAQLSATQQDRLLRFGALIKSELDASDQRLALIARAGLNLSHFGLRYSHAGLSLRDSPNSPWSVRQLYYACDEGRPRLFDQGMAGFVYGADSPDVGYVSVLLLPPAEAAVLERTALDDRRALALLGGVYSANAYAYSERYQNCNQWLIELLAMAWGGEAVPAEAADARQQAQHWLGTQGYEPSVLKVGFPPLMWATALLRFVHSDDHPDADLSAHQFRVSMPDSIERFVQQRLPAQVQRLEFCHNERHMLMRRDGPPIAAGCQAEPGDRVIPLS